MTSRDCFVQMLFTVKVILCNVCSSQLTCVVVVTICIVILFMITTIVAIVIAVVVCCRKQSKHRYVRMQHKHSHYTTASNGIMYIWHYSGFIFIIYIILYVVTMCMFSEVSNRD